MVLHDKIYNSLNNYFSLLSHTGYKSYNEVYKLIVLSFIGDIISSDIKEYLTEEELAAARRGKNHKITSMPKNVDPKIYKKATGFEALIGFLEVSGADGRLEEILEKTFEIIENEKIIVNRR